MTANVIPFRTAMRTAALCDAAQAAALALRTFKVSPELDQAIAALRREIEGGCWRMELLRASAEEIAAFHAGLRGESQPPAAGGARRAFIRGHVLRAQLRRQRAPALLPRLRFFKRGRR